MAPLFLREKTGAPALSRGLAVLISLDPLSPPTLDQISSGLDLPKASTLRLLETLERTGMIRRNPDKRYEPLWKLEPLEDPRVQFRQNLKAKMETLCHETGCTVEWYEAADDGLRLILQTNPDVELCVKAKPGFLRDWQREFEAVTRVGHAFAKNAPSIQSTTVYVENGRLRKISQRQIRRLTDEARVECAAYDEAFNTNGVRRYAVAAFTEQDKQFLGVLALAEVYHFNRSSNPRLILKQIQKILSQ